MLKRMCGLMAWSRIYRFEAAPNPQLALAHTRVQKKTIARVLLRSDLLLPQKVPKVRNGVFCIADQLCLGLRSLELFAVDVRQYGRDLAICTLACQFAVFALESRVVVLGSEQGGVFFARKHLPPSSFAMTAIFPSCERQLARIFSRTKKEGVSPYRRRMRNRAVRIPKRDSDNDPRGGLPFSSTHGAIGRER
jgi:hypothetical protein